VFECWHVTPDKTSAVPVWFTQLNYPAPTAAIVERQHGVGRVVMVTTGVTLKEGGRGWSRLAAPDWDFLLFAHDLMNYLSRQSAAKFNYPAGDEAKLRLAGEKKMESYLFRTPDGAQQSRNVPEDVSELTLVDTDQVGHYRVLDADTNSDFAVGFSVNAPAEESDLTKLETEELTEMFGENRFRISRSLEELERLVTEGRLGQELFPQVLVLVLVFFCAEHLVSNRFYEADQQPEQGAK
jgi:hypothetical protein